MLPFVSVQTMRACDAAAIAAGTPARELMRRAGKGIFEAWHRWGKTAVICGSGNNAGDGYVLALHLAEKGFPVTVFLLSDTFSEDGRYYYEQCRQKNIPIYPYEEQTDFSCFDTLADCLFGTGFHGEPRGLAAHCIENMNASGVPVVSADINSGLDGDSGQGALCVRSALTVSVQFYQPGHFLGRAKDVIGERRCVDIGIPLQGEVGYVAESRDFRAFAAPRAKDSHKGTYGYVALMGGCMAYSGAVKLSNLACAALRSGCGVVKLAAAESLAPAITPYLLESTLFPLPDDGRGNALFDRSRLEELFRGTRALACGMGWGKAPDYPRILQYILEKYPGRLILDADGLNTLAGMGTNLLSRSVCEGIVLTPHPMEFSRLTGESLSDILKHPVECARRFAAPFEGRCVVLLKGTATVVTDGEQTRIVDRGSPGMATAGSGDVLSGVLAGLLGYHPVSVESVACAAYLAGRAGEIAAERVGEIAMLSSDTVAALPEALRELSEAVDAV